MREPEDRAMRAPISMTKRRTAALLATGTVMAAIAIGGVAWATIPSNNVITTCYLKSGGTLRVIDSTTGSCSSKETALSWNVQGIPGATGPTGPTGPSGPAGPTGSPGAAGISGYELVSESSTAVDVFEPGRVDVTVDCPTGKRFLGGGYAFYLVPPGFAPQWTPADRANALPESFGGEDSYAVTVIHPIPAGYGAKLTATIACGYVAS